MSETIGPGMLIGVCDREGTPIRIGDTLEFDEREWGGPDNRFVVEWQDGRLLHNGSLSDLTEWCRVVERAAPPSPWQPIETAPRDGSDILVAKAGQWVCEASWWDRWHNDTNNPGWMPANLDEEYGSYVEPTHWMPLPEPPAL